MTDTFQADRERMLATIDAYWASKARYPGRRWAYDEHWFPYNRARWLNEVVLDSRVFDLRDQMSAWDQGEGSERISAFTLREVRFHFPEAWQGVSVWAHPEMHEPALRAAAQHMIERIQVVRERAAEHGGTLVPFLPLYPKMGVHAGTLEPSMLMLSCFGIRGMDQDVAFNIVQEASVKVECGIRNCPAYPT